MANGVNVTERLIAEVLARGSAVDGTGERGLDDYSDAAIRAGRESKKFGDGQRSVAKDSDAATASLGGLAAKLGAAAAAYLTVGAAIQQLMAGTQAAIQLESVNRSLSVATGGAEQGAEAFAFVRSEAERLGLALGPTAQEFSKLSAASIGTKLAGEGVRDIFSAVSEASSVLGLSADQQSGALLALGQIMSKGTVQAEELRGQLGERIPGAFQVMARGLGVTTQELGKMLEKGEVLAEEALPAFAAELRRSFGTDSQQRMETSAAGMARFATAVFDARVALGTAFLPAVGEATGALAEMLSQNEDTLASLGELAGVGVGVLVDGLGLLLSHLTEIQVILGAIGIVKLASILSSLVTGVGVAIGEMVALTGATVAATEAQVALAGAVAATVPIFNAQGKVISTVTTQTVAWGGATHGVAAAQAVATTSSATLVSIGLTPLALGLGAVVGGLLAANAAINIWADNLEDATQRAILATREFTSELDDLQSSAQSLVDAGDLQAMSSALGTQTTQLEAARKKSMEAQAEMLRLAAVEKRAAEQGNLHGRFLEELTEKQEAASLAFNKAKRETDALNNSTEILKDGMRKWVPVGEKVDKTAKAIAKALEEIAAQKETSRFMREFGLSAEDAGEAARLKLAEGVDLADAAVVQLIQNLRAGRDELEFLTLLAGTAPGQLEERDFGGFGGVGEEAPGGDFTAFERAAQITGQMATDEERRLKAVVEAKKLREAGLITEETYQRVLAANADTFEVLNDEADEHLTIWERIASAAIQGAQNAEGAWGNMLGFIGENINGILDGVGMLGQMLTDAGETEVGGLLMGFERIASGDIGGGIGAIAGGFGLTEGNYLAEGAQVGAQFGGVAGALIGATLGAFVSRGKDDLHSTLQEVGGRADLVVTQAEGELAKVADQAEAVLEGFFNSLQASLSADLDFAAPGLEFHARGEDRFRVVVNGIEKIFDSFEEAIAFAAQGVLAANAEAEGLGENMRALFSSISGPEVVGSLEELQAAINLASVLDFEETGVTGELTRHRQELIALGAKYGLSLEAIIALEDKRIAAMKRALEAEIASVFGVDDVAGRFRNLTGAVTQFDAELAHEQEARQKRLDTLQAEIAAMEAAGSEMGGLAQEAVGVGEATGATGRILQGLRDEGLRAGEGMQGLSDDIAGAGSASTEAGREFLHTKGSIDAMREEAEALRASLEEGTEAFGAEEVGKLWTTAADQVAVSLIQMIQAISGESANAQELEEIRERQFLFTLAAQIQQAQIVLATMEFVSDAVRAMLEGVIADATGLLEGLASGEVDFPVAGDGGGRGDGRGRQRREALADARREFRDTVEDMIALMGGATDRTLALAQAQADLAEKGREAKLSVEEIAAAVQMLAELQVAEITDPFRATSQQRRESGTATAVRESQEAAQTALAEALVASGDDPELYREAALAITRGLNAEFAAIGEEGLAGIGGARAALALEQREMIREIDFLRENAEALGLSLRQISNAVRDNVLPDLFGILERQAKRVGDEDALALIQERRAKFELRLEQLKFELLVKQLEAADAITPALQGWIDMGREFFELPTAVGPGPGGDDGAVLRLETTVGGGGVGRSSQVATSQAQALARALDAVAQQTEEWLDAGIDPFQDRLNDLTDRFTDLAAAVLSAGGSLEDVIELEEALAVARQDLLDDLLSGVEERLRTAELEAPGALPAERLATLQGAFAEAIAAAQAAPGEETFADAFELFDLLSAFAGEQFTGGTLAAFLAQLGDQLGTLGDLTLEDLELPTQEELLAEISSKLSDVDTSVGGVGSAVGGVQTAVKEIPIAGIDQTTLDALTDAIGELAVADLIVEFGATALGDLKTTLEGIDIGNLDFDGVVAALGGIGNPLADLVLAIGPEGFKAFIDALNPIATNTANTTTNTASTTTALTSPASDRIGGRLQKLNATIGLGGATLKSMVFDIKTDVGRMAGGGNNLARSVDGRGTQPAFDELLVLNTAAIQGNTAANEANTAEIRTLSASVVALKGAVDRMRPLAGGR